MKTRILVAAVGIPLLLVVIFFLPLWVFGLVVGAICACAAWEFLRATEPEGSTRFRVYAAAAGALIAFGSAFDGGATVTVAVLFLLTVVLFGELMLSFRGEERLPFERVALGLVAGGVIPALLSALVRIGVEKEPHSVFILLPFVITMVSDSAAYFTGMALGRHKLAPHLSPNKTIEGSIGAFVGAIAAVLIYGLILMLLGFEIRFLVLIIYGFLGSLLCQLGDLSFSAVKRLAGIKDYGNLIPGHGGALDRFDSMVFVAPLVEILLNWEPAIL